MSRFVQFLSLPVLIFSTTIGNLGAYNDHLDTISGEFWAELEPVSIESAQFGPPERRKRIEAMLEEARFVFSGMIYGYSFRYVPSDKQRQIEEVFTLEPDAEIPWGSAALTVRQSYSYEGKLYAVIDYRLAEHEQYRVEAWERNTAVPLSGRGEGVYFTGPEEKITAHTNAVKSAIREYLRTLTYNKPREVRGTFVFAESPRVFAESGKYVSSVQIRLILDSLEPYSGY